MDRAGQGKARQESRKECKEGQKERHSLSVDPPLSQSLSQFPSHARVRIPPALLLLPRLFRPPCGRFEPLPHYACVRTKRKLRGGTACDIYPPHLDKLVSHVKKNSPLASLAQVGEVYSTATLTVAPTGSWWYDGCSSSECCVLTWRLGDYPSYTVED